MVQENKSVSKEEIEEMCKELKRVATSEYDGEETQICHKSGDRIWVDSSDLDWLADEVEDTTAKKLRRIMKYSIDFQGGYYYIDL